MHAQLKSICTRRYRMTTPTYRRSKIPGKKSHYRVKNRSSLKGSPLVCRFIADAYQSLSPALSPASKYSGTSLLATPRVLPASRRLRPRRGDDCADARERKRNRRRKDERSSARGLRRGILSTGNLARVIFHPRVPVA